MTDKPTFPKTPFDEHLLAVGHIAAAWASLEHHINQVIWALASVEDRDGACLTAQMPSLLSRLRALISLVGENGGSEELIADLNRFSHKADALSRRRNRVIHDTWYHDEGVVSQLEITADRKLKFAKQPIELSALRELWDDIFDAGDAFSDLHKRIGLDLRASLSKHLGPDHQRLLDRPNSDSDEK
jgi:hypothetical protein